MTFDDDFMQIEFAGGTKRVLMKSANVEWPGPDVLDFMGFQFKKVSHSQISDDDRKELTMIMRGARYVPLEN